MLSETIDFLRNDFFIMIFEQLFLPFVRGNKDVLLAMRNAINKVLREQHHIKT